MCVNKDLYKYIKERAILRDDYEHLTVYFQQPKYTK